MYIRTKDKIYKVFESPLNDDEDFVYVAPNGCISETDIINQSENLEELCDCFVTKGNKHIVWDKQHHNKGILFEQVKFSFASEDFEIYGAIWTDKGLIYVAKMNENGDLELI